MAEIATTDAYGLYTKKLIAIYRERIASTNFLRSFFQVEESTSKSLSIEVERNQELIAVDVARGSDGVRNQWSYTSERIFVPPYFKEYFDITNLQLYDRLFGATSIDDAVFAELINSTADKTMQMQQKVERAIELQCAQVFLDGIVTLKNGTNIDYKRQGGSKVDPGAGNYFADAGGDPYALLEAGCVFMRKEGLATGQIFNAIIGTEAWHDLLENAKFKTRQGFFNLALDAVTGPQKNNNTGANLMGKLVCGSYIVQLWTYEQYYNHPDTGTKTQYMDPKMVVMLPADGTSFKLGFAAIPQLIMPNTMPRKGQFLIRDFINQEAQTHNIILESAPLAIPVSVDRIYTFRAKAA